MSNNTNTNNTKATFANLDEVRELGVSECAAFGAVAVTIDCNIYGTEMSLTVHSDGRIYQA